MEIIGDDKRIRALFSETRFADEQAAPSFTAAWSRAQSRALKPRSAFNLSFAVATALLVCALASLGLWSRYSQPSERSYAVFATVAAPSLNTSVIKTGLETISPTSQENKQSHIKSPRALVAQRNALMLAANRKAEQRAEQEAKQLASWQSPTASLLSSSSDSLFKSLPQLNENSVELKSFLPKRENEKEK